MRTLPFYKNDFITRQDAHVIRNVKIMYQICSKKYFIRYCIYKITNYFKLSDEIAPILDQQFDSYIIDS